MSRAASLRCLRGLLDDAGQDVGLGLGLHVFQGQVLVVGQGEGLAEDQVVAFGLLHLHGAAVAGQGHAVAAQHSSQGDLGDLLGHSFLLLGRQGGLGQPALDGVGLGRIGADARDTGSGGLVGLADGDPLGVLGVVEGIGRVALGGLLVGPALETAGLAEALADHLHGIRHFVLGLDGEHGLLLGGQAVVERLLLFGQGGEDDGGRGGGGGLHGGLLGGGGSGGGFGSDGGGLASHDELLRRSAAVVLS